MSEDLLMMNGQAKLPPAWRDFVDQAVETLKLEMIREWAVRQAASTNALPAAVATPAANGKLSLASAVERRVASLSPVGKRGPRAKQTPLAALYDAGARSSARRLNLDLLSATSVLHQGNLKTQFNFIDRELTDTVRLTHTAVDIFDTRIERADMSPSGPSLTSPEVARGLNLGGGDAVSRILSEQLSIPRSTAARLSNGGTIVQNGGLRFRLHEVKCVDETDPEWVGSDEISLGGVAQGPGGSPAMIAEFKVADGFDDGDKRTYSPPRILHTFPLGGLQYPSAFAVFVAIAEKDAGGFSQFLQDLWQAIKDHVQTIMNIIGTAAGAAVGAWIGGSTGTAIAPALGTVIGIVLGAILGALVAILVNALKDDLFRPQTAAIELPSQNATFSGGTLVSPTQSLIFEDFDGLYNVKYSWEIVR